MLLKELTQHSKGLRLPDFAYSDTDLSWEDCIYQIRHMPDLVMKYEHGLILESSREDEDDRLIQSVRAMYANQADWLEYYFLENTKILPEIDSTNKKYYKPLAEMSLATLKLAQEICAFCDWLNKQSLSPRRWFLACEWEFCEQVLQNSGYISKPTLLGSSKYYSDMVARDRLLDDSSQIKLIEVGILETTPIQALEGLACVISQPDSNVCFRNTHYREYRAVIKRCARQLRDSPLNPIYLNFNKVLQTKRGRGFGKHQKRIMK